MGDAQRADPSPFAFDGGPIGCLLLHGFSGSPAEMRPLGEFLAEHGIAVSAPLLPGHGTVPDDLNRVHWEDWVSAAEEALVALRARAPQVFIAGLSMGGVLACYLARYDATLAGLILYAPAFQVRSRLFWLAPLFKGVVRQFPKGKGTDLTDPEAASRLWHYPTYAVRGAAEFLELQRRARRELGAVRIPTIAFYSSRDANVPISATRFIDRLGTPDREIVILHNSGHCMTVDSERGAIFARTWGFIRAHSTG